MFEELLRLLTLSRVHNGPQRASSESYNERLSTESGWTINSNNNKLINEAGSLCSSDSVEEENEIEEQSGGRIQRQIQQSQRGKAKTVHVENSLSTANFPFRFLIQLSSQTAHKSCDFPFVYRKLR